jgi:lipopolysaccharide/colanic/teichoic acid biosynthesis glycosyltransferase
VNLSRERVLQAIPPAGRRDVALEQRVLDVCLAVFGLLTLAVVMAVIALLIWLESGRPIFFSQIRLGQHGLPFRLYKFRKFREGATAAGAAVTVQNDHRMTRVGRILAQTKLDELPQLWNILKGDMSVVGPRPEALAFADCYDERYRGVLRFRPGIFGPNQMFFRNEGALFPPDRDPEEFYRAVLFPLKARVDLAYFRNRTLWGDVAWIVRGILAIFQWHRGNECEHGMIEQAENWARQHMAAPKTSVSRRG